MLEQVPLMQDEESHSPKSRSSRNASILKAAFAGVGLLLVLTALNIHGHSSFRAPRLPSCFKGLQTRLLQLQGRTTVNLLFC